MNKYKNFYFSLVLIVISEVASADRTPIPNICSRQKQAQGVIKFLCYGSYQKPVCTNIKYECESEDLFKKVTIDSEEPEFDDYNRCFVKYRCCYDVINLGALTSSEECAE